MLAQDKLFMTVSSTAFVHMHHYKQHKIKVPRRDVKKDLTSSDGVRWLWAKSHKQGREVKSYLEMD